MSRPEPTPRFDQTRKEWATSTPDELATQCYCDYYDVPEEDVYSLEGLVENEHVTTEGYQVHQILDYAGIDTVVDCGTRIITVAQRWRPNSSRRVDFNLRVDNGVEDRHAEHTKWTTAHAEHGFYPSVCAFGVFDSLIDAFCEFHLIDTASLLEALAAGAIEGEEHPSGDGTAACYIPVEQLREADCILESWDGVTEQEGEQ